MKPKKGRVANPLSGGKTRDVVIANYEMSERSALLRAYSAGWNSGDTDLFDKWLKRADIKFGGAEPGFWLKRNLREQYNKGVERGISDRHRERTNKREWANLKRRQSRRNPCGDSFRKAGPVTDRASRYRANQPECRPDGPKRCIICHGKKNITVHHWDGRESNVTPENLEYACKACNTLLGAAYKRLGLGRKTRQFNPGAVSAGQWLKAVMSICPKDGRYGPPRGCERAGTYMPVDDAVALIRDTSQSDRRRFSAELGRYHRQGARGVVPF